MKAGGFFGLLALLIIAIIAISSTFYTLSESEQAIVTQFGKVRQSAAPLGALVRALEDPEPYVFGQARAALQKITGGRVLCSLWSLSKASWISMSQSPCSKNSLTAEMRISTSRRISSSLTTSSLMMICCPWPGPN